MVMIKPEEFSAQVISDNIGQDFSHMFINKYK